MSLSSHRIPVLARPCSRRGFTLFEVTISLLILVVSVLSIILAYPVGIKAQRMARFQVYAGAKVLQLMDHLANSQHDKRGRQVESKELGRNTLMRWETDLDTMFQLPELGMLPLPTEIAKRIDSDNDEIAKLIQEGGRLYYVAPMDYEVFAEAAGLHGGHGGLALADSVSMVFGVIGYAQQNALPNHPLLAWPYFDFYPSPAQAREKDEWERQAALGSDPGWMDGKDEFLALYALVNADNFDSVMEPAQSGGDAGATAAFTTVQAYIKAAENLAMAVGVPSTGGPEFIPRDPFDLSTIPPPWSDPSNPDLHPKPYQVLALRYLAHAMEARVCWPFRDSGRGTYELTKPQIPYDEARARLCQEACLKWIMRYAATMPYDWGAPRPLNRQTCFDFPLLQYDLFPSASFPSAITSDGDVSWLIVGREKPVNYWHGHSQYGWTGPLPDNSAALQNSWGDIGHFNLTNRFAAAERTRRLCCWSVDWQSYEDFEELPDDAFDANIHFMDSTGTDVSSERVGNLTDMHYHFTDSSRTDTYHQGPDYDSIVWHTRNWENPGYRAMYLGRFGADRNGNNVFDHGPLPKSTRIRATSIVQVDYYDQRIISALRN